MLLLLALQLAQAPSPMVENTRAHGRVERRATPGDRIPTRFGEIVLPPGAKPGKALPLVVHFHGEPWLAEQSVREAIPKAAVLGVQLGSGSRVYAGPFRDPAAFQEILTALNRPAQRIYLTAFSAGYGAVREILKRPENAAHVTGVVLLDGMHSGYEQPEEDRKPLPGDLDAFEQYARQAMAGKVSFLILHSEIFPSTFASTTETSDWLLATLGLKRRPVLRWGPHGMQMLSEAKAGRLRVYGFAGNSAPDHVDHYHALAWALRRLK